MILSNRSSFDCYLLNARRIKGFLWAYPIAKGIFQIFNPDGKPCGILNEKQFSILCAKTAGEIEEPISNLWEKSDDVWASWIESGGNPETRPNADFL